jgi:hypothetical protein
MINLIHLCIQMNEAKDEAKAESEVEVPNNLDINAEIETKIENSDKSDKLLFTKNTFADICDFYKQGCGIVFAIGKNAYFIYHKCKDVNLSDEELDKLKIVHMDFTDEPSLLGEGEWPEFLKEAKVFKCECNAKQYCLAPKNLTLLWQVQIPSIFDDN